MTDDIFEEKEIEYEDADIDDEYIEVVEMQIFDSDEVETDDS